MKLPYTEGTWFAVPLRKGGYATGVVSRCTAEGRVILCYFFGPRREVLPSISDVEALTADAAIRVIQISDLALIKEEWPIIGQAKLWNRSEWPMPVFLRRDPLRPKAWRVHYSDTNPNEVIREEPVPYDTSGLPEDVMSGAGAVEIVLSKLLE